MIGNAWLQKNYRRLFVRWERLTTCSEALLDYRYDLHRTPQINNGIDSYANH